MQRSMPLAGSDILYIVAPSSNINQSTVLAEFDLNPIELTSVTRLRQFAPLWDKFKWRSLWLAYKPSCGANAQGILGVAADPDKLDNYTTLAGLPLDQKVASSLHNFSGPVNRPWSMRITDSKFFGMSRFMEPAANSDPRMYTAGKLVITNEGLLTAGNYGRFYLYWKIDFEEPNTDEVVDQAIGFAAGLTGTYISATYPWGDYSAIQAAGFTANTVFKNTNFVTFKSDATLGSVIEFLRQGNYLVTITRTGVAMGTGSFTGATYSNCSIAWDSDEYGTGLNQAISNGGSTASQWVVAIKVTALPAYMADTADAGVTHTTGITTVSFVDDIPTADDFTEAKVLKALKKLTVGDLMRIMQSKISCTSPDEPWVKFPPRTLRSVPPEPLATGNLVETVSGTINQGDGPSQTITLNTTGTLDMGTITDPVFVEIDALRKKVQRAKEKKIMMRKRLEELELESSDSDS